MKIQIVINLNKNLIFVNMMVVYLDLSIILKLKNVFHLIQLLIVNLLKNLMNVVNVYLVIIYKIV